MSIIQRKSLGICMIMIYVDDMIVIGHEESINDVEE